MGVSRIQLDEELSTLVDTADIALLNGFNWRPLRLSGNHVYAHAWHGEMHFYMHRFLLGVVDRKTEIDHRNGDGLDNRRSNLRVATHSQNLVNAGKQPRERSIAPSSAYKGVYWDTARRRWGACISVNSKRKALGRFHNEEEAARS